MEFLTNKIFAISTFSFFGLIGFSIYLISKKKIIQYGKIRVDADGRRIKYVQEGLKSIIEIKMMNISELFKEFYKKQILMSYLNIIY